MIDVATLFPHGKLPPLPQMEISKLTAKEISQEKVDLTLQMLWDQKPDLIIALAECELYPKIGQEEFERRLNSTERYIYKEIAPNIGGYEILSAYDQVMWEVRLRIRRMLGLPATTEEVQAALDRGEQVI